MAIHEAQVVPGRSDVGVGVGQVGHGGWASVVGFFGLTKINVVDGGGGGVGQDGFACRPKFLLECVYFSPQLMLFFFGAQFLSGKILGQQCGQFGVHGWLVWVVGVEKGCLGVLELGNGERMVRRVGFAGGGEGWKWWLEEWFGMVCVNGSGVLEAGDGVVVGAGVKIAGGYGASFSLLVFSCIGLWLIVAF